MKVTDAYQSKKDRPLVICDFSPPRGASREFLSEICGLDSDFISVAYNPGRSVRANSAMLAHAIKHDGAKDVIFNLATRDMNRLAIQSHILGASLLGLDNLVVVSGDDFSKSEERQVKSVHDFKPTDLIKAVSDMNKGYDFKGQLLRESTNLCIGAAIDTSKDNVDEARLTHRKVEAGCQFFISEPILDVKEVQSFRTTYQKVTGQPLLQPVFWGLQILVTGGVSFRPIPTGLTRDLGEGRDGVDIALDMWNRFKQKGIDSIYLIPPIMSGGARDYHAAKRLLRVVRQVV